MTTEKYKTAYLRNESSFKSREKDLGKTILISSFNPENPNDIFRTVTKKNDISGILLDLNGINFSDTKKMSAWLNEAMRVMILPKKVVAVINPPPGSDYHDHHRLMNCYNEHKIEYRGFFKWNFVWIESITFNLIVQRGESSREVCKYNRNQKLRLCQS